MPIMGRCNVNRRLTIPVSVSNGEAPFREIQVEIDTASDDGLGLSPQEIAELGLMLSDDTDLRLNGTSGATLSYIAYVEWHDGPIPVNVVETDRPPYAGMGLLWDSYLTGYLFPNGAVFVNRMVHWDDIKREAQEE